MMWVNTVWWLISFLSYGDINVLGKNISESACFIPGSFLESNVWYSIDMEGFTPGYLTWTTKSNRKSRGIQWHLYHIFGLNDTAAAKYRKGGEWYESTLWEFLPSEGYPGWYKMRNARFPDSYVTWSRGEFVPTHPGNGSNYLILERSRNEADYMLKPVFMELERGIQFHRLIMRHFPKGMINWSRDEYNKYGHYIQNHHTGSKSAMARYEKGGDYYDDTLFIFIEADKTPSKSGCGTYARNSGNVGICDIFLIWLLLVLLLVFP